MAVYAAALRNPAEAFFWVKPLNPTLAVAIIAIGRRLDFRSDAICAATPMLTPKAKRMGATMIVSEGAGDRCLRWTPLWLAMAEVRGTLREKPRAASLISSSARGTPACPRKA